MTTLTPTELIELLPVELKDVDAILHRFEIAAPIECRDPGYVQRLVDEGFMKLHFICWHGKRAYLIGWHLSADNGFWLDLVQTLDAGAPASAGVEGTERLARSLNARYVRWVTLRRGIARKLADRFGYKPEAVILTKVL